MVNSKVVRLILAPAFNPMTLGWEHIYWAERRNGSPRRGNRHATRRATRDRKKRLALRCNRCSSLRLQNLYNAALYEIRQAYIFEGRYISYIEMDKRMQQHEAYKALPAKVAQKVLDQLDKAWQSFFEARKAYKQDPSKFSGCPRLPKYKHKTDGRNLLVYTHQAVSQRQLK